MRHGLNLRAAVTLSVWGQSRHCRRLHGGDPVRTKVLLRWDPFASGGRAALRHRASSFCTLFSCRILSDLRLLRSSRLPSRLSSGAPAHSLSCSQQRPRSSHGQTSPRTTTSDPPLLSAVSTQVERHPQHPLDHPRPLSPQQRNHRPSM